MELLGGNRRFPLELRDGRAFGRLTPGDVCCVSPVPFVKEKDVDYLARNRVRETLFSVLQEVGQLKNRAYSHEEFARFQENPVDFLHEVCGVGLDVTEWTATDARRVVMIPPN